MTRPALFIAALAAGAVVLTACSSEDTSDAGPSTSSTVSTTRSSSATGSSAPAAEPPAPAAQPPAPAAPAPAGEVPADPPAPAAEPPADPPAPGAPPAPEPPAPAPAADPCAEVTDEYLITTARMTGSGGDPLADLRQTRCSGTFASAMSHPEGTLHPVMYLFEYSEQNGRTHWHLIDIGEGLDCVNRHGVPADVGSAIGCASGS